MQTYKKLIQHANKEYFEQKGSIRMKMAEKEAKKLAHEEYKQRKKAKYESESTTKALTVQTIQ